MSPSVHMRPFKLISPNQSLTTLEYAIATTQISTSASPTVVVVRASRGATIWLAVTSAAVTSYPAINWSRTIALARTWTSVWTATADAPTSASIPLAALSACAPRAMSLLTMTKLARVSILAAYCIRLLHTCLSFCLHSSFTLFCFSF